MTELAVRPTAGHLTVAPDQTFWTEDQALVLRQAGVDDDVTHAELTNFLHLTQRTGLDPFSRQIYLIGRWDARVGRKVFTPQTGIDGYRVVRDRVIERTHGTLSYDDTLWCGPDGEWKDIWLDDDVPPVASKVTIFRDGGRFSATAKFSEYKQTKKGGELVGLWGKMPSGQIAKCAEALALRKAFPQDLAGVYTAEEMAQADNPRDDDQRGAQRHQPSRPADDQWTTPPSRVIVEQQDRDAEASQVVDPAPGGPAMASKGQLANLAIGFKNRGISDTDRLRHTSQLLGREVTTFKDLTLDEYRTVHKAQAGGWPLINHKPTVLPDLPEGLENNPVRDILVANIADATSPATLDEAGRDVAAELARGGITPAEGEYVRAVWTARKAQLQAGHQAPVAERPAPVGAPDNPGIADYQRRMLDGVAARQQHTRAAMVGLAQRILGRDSITDLGQLSKAEADALLHTLTTGEKPAMAGAA